MDSSLAFIKKHTKKSNLIGNPVKNMSLTDSIYIRKVYRLQEKRTLTPDTYVLRFNRNDMEFRAGQHITLGIPGNNQVREYSIYSTEQDPWLEVLIREVDTGLVSKQLRKLIPGELLEVDGPFGYFTVDKNNFNKKLLFVGTGTGIAPFRSITGTFPSLDYKILHGVRYGAEAYERHKYPADRYMLCTTRDKEGSFNGRVTEYLKEKPLDSDTLVYLCGNCDMIYDVYDLLTSRGFPSGNIKTEVYF
ncbi:MAG TPA: FAD-binding oxidoreductase [Bacteroidales bacterium]|jgi:ferredoxin--NADP+ reductase/benzoate/toluate 1,2-dioxygenase reductase subunit|nr:FAD-binding oxidoreductase [Bacteroidales bacterium]